LLNIGRMGPGRADYYLTAVARGADGVEGYYLARGEEPGRWLGTGADTLGLSGEVTAEQLRAVLDAHHPETGQQLASHPARKVPGFDHTFRAPKSVSLLWALSDRATAEQVVAAHDAAVDAAIGYLQRAAGFSRRGAGGAETVEVDGFVAAAFRHRTSRADDPLLHTHVLVANLARTSDDGIWRTLDSRRLFAHAKTAGVLYQAQLRYELTTRLGVAWQPVINGVADIAGVDRQLIETFSRRRAAIVELLAARGETSAAAAQTATLATRQAKGERASETELRGDWGRRAAAAGVPPGWPTTLTGQAVWHRPDLNGLYRTLVVDEQLTTTSSTFTRRDVLQQLAGLLPAGAPVSYLEQAADAVIAHDPDQLIPLGTTRGQLTGLDVIRRTDGRLVPVDPNERRYTTRGLLLTEQRAINRSLDRHDDQVAAVDSRTLEAALRRRTLSDEQAAMVRQLTSSGAGVEVVVGKAGTGKTYALDAARAAWEASGIRVTGVALAARAALELQESAGIRSTTLARLLGRVDGHREGSPLAPGSVLVVDEAGMIGTRQLARLLDQAEQRSVKVVLVGDPKQLPEIDAGGLFRALTTRLPAIELTDNRRQTHVWEQAALDELRHGDPDTAFAAYRTHDRIHAYDTPEQLRDRLVNDWWATARDDLPGSIMIALRRSDVDELNHRARAMMATAGRLTGPALTTADGIELQAGDRIVCLRNNGRFGVVNGTRATITRIRIADRAVEAVDDRGGLLRLSAAYLDAGHVAHGYSITGHKAQGLTCDHTYTLGSETLYREWGYVAMSRGRLSNHLYHGPALDDDGLHHHVHLDTDQTASLTSRLGRSRAHQPVTPELVEIAARWQQLHTRLHAPDIARQRDLTRQRAQLAKHRTTDADQLDRVGRRLYDATHGLGRLRNRQLVTQLRNEHENRTEQLHRLEHQLHQIDTELAILPSDRQIADLQDQHRLLDSELDRAASHRIASYRHAWPEHLTAALGPPPADSRGHERWEQGAFAIEKYRLHWHVTDPHRPLGHQPADALEHHDYQRTRQTIDRIRSEVHTDRTPSRSLQRGISR
jgi:Ti-type conjugative transfer relaxase TraA